MFQVFHRYTSLKALFICSLDIALAFACLFAGFIIRYAGDTGPLNRQLSQRAFWLQSILVVGFIHLLLHVTACYQLDRPYAGRLRIRFAKTLATGCLVPGLLSLAYPALIVDRESLLIGLIALFSITFFGRSTLEALWSLTPFQTVAILGSGELARNVAKEIYRRRDLNWRFAGFIVEDNPSQTPQVAPILGRCRDLEQIVAAGRIALLVVAQKEQRGHLPVGALVSIRTSGVAVEDAATMLAGLSGRIWLDVVRPSWFVFTGGFRRPLPVRLIKRAVDAVVAFVGFTLTLPIMGIVMILIRLDSKGPILYRQVRIGYRGRPFTLLKFRSMRQDAEEGGAQWAIRKDPRITKIGAFLRKFRLDELPQFINVLRGEMSLIGPRPERPDFTDQLRIAIPFYDERHTVRPGITGLAQVRYRYCATITDAFHKLEYDMFYLKHLSLLFDMFILLLTARTVLLGAEWTDSHVEVPDFRSTETREETEGESRRMTMGA
ncbi:MAG: exopolysaccharide biosynthesis polyprenyl glycosylphosphotransferase [Bryobacteraceae bacterium]|jgi:sugar transferase (PEP-CTERM system associated)